MKQLAQKLWMDNQDLAEANLRGRFVRGLNDGSLSRDAFKKYVTQDAFFLESFARAYAFALASCSDREGLYAFADLLNGVLQELKLHASYAQKWDIDLSNINPHTATLNYVKFLLDVCRQGNVGEICAAMTPCMRLYAFLGQRLATDQKTTHDYSDWINTYADPSFEQLALRLEQLLDEYGNLTSNIRNNYRKAMELELAFFEAHA